MKQKPETKINVLREIDANKVFPVYLLCGKETFLIEGTLKQMLDKLLSPDTRDFNLTILDGSTVSVRDILSNVELYPTMSDWRVVIVENFSAFKSQKRTTSPLTVIREAMLCESEDVQKCVNDVAKLLGISTQQIADRNSDYIGAVDEISKRFSHDYHNLPVNLMNIKKLEVATKTQNYYWNGLKETCLTRVFSSLLKRMR